RLFLRRLINSSRKKNERDDPRMEEQSRCVTGRRAPRLIRVDVGMQHWFSFQTSLYSPHHPFTTTTNPPHGM
ncbi:unnamed protein product, partial [Pleuronectes platessa]